jgi:hypothetical protein
VLTFFIEEEALEKEKNHLQPSKAKGWFSSKVIHDNRHPDGRGCGEKCWSTSLFIYISII